jgi:hypothetical protein
VLKSPLPEYEKTTVPFTVLVVIEGDAVTVVVSVLVFVEVTVVFEPVTVTVCGGWVVTTVSVSAGSVTAGRVDVITLVWVTVLLDMTVCVDTTVSVTLPLQPDKTNTTTDRTLATTNKNFLIRTTS